MKQTFSRRRSSHAIGVTEKSSVPPLFAEGVDVGVELALRWMEEELAHGERIDGSIQEALRSIRQQVRHCSYLQQVLRTSPAPTSRSRRVLTSARDRGSSR